MKIDNKVIVCILALSLIGSVAYANIYFNGIDADNLFENADIHLHTDFTQAISGAGAWSNMSFTHNGDALKHNFLHTYNDNTNDTITVVQDGIYDLKYAVNFNNTNANPDNYAIIRIVVNNVEVNGSGMGRHMTKQNAQVPVSGCVRAELTAGDEVKLQFTSDSTDSNVMLQSDLYLTHYDSARLCIVRVR